MRGNKSMEGIETGQEELDSSSKVVYDVQTNRAEIPIWKKFVLTVQEASEYFHIGEKKIRQLVNENMDADFFFYNGSKVLIKRIKFENFIDKATAV